MPGRPFGAPAQLCPIQATREGPLRHVLQAGGTEAFRPRHAVPALVLVPRLQASLRGRDQERSRLRDRLLGYCAQSLLLNPFSPPPASQPSGRAWPPSRRRESIGAKTSASATTSKRWARSTPTTTRWTIARACRPSSRRWKAWPQRNPKDDEAQIFYALALNVGASPADKTYANQLKAAEHPREDLQAPAAASWRRALPDPYSTTIRRSPRRAWPPPSAIRRSRAAAPHAQHMPSHIFTRVGYWKDSIASNAESARVAKLEQGARRSAARDGLPRLCAPAARAGQEGARGDR